MNIRSKRRICDLLRAAGVIILFLGVPVWLFMIMLITGSRWIAFALICWVWVSWVIGRRFE